MAYIPDPQTNSHYVARKTSGTTVVSPTVVPLDSSLDYQVTVKINGVAYTQVDVLVAGNYFTYSEANGGTVTINDPAVDYVIDVQLYTKLERQVDHSTSTIIRGNTLNLDATQLLALANEAKDMSLNAPQATYIEDGGSELTVYDINDGTIRTTRVPTEHTDVATKIYVDTFGGTLETTLQDQIDDIVVDVTALESGLADEITNRGNADDALQLLIEDNDDDILQLQTDLTNLTSAAITLTGTETLTNKTITDLSNIVSARVGLLRCKANESISAGDPISIVGWNYGANYVTVEKADNLVAPANGICDRNLNINEYGGLVMFGVVEGVDTLAWPVGSLMYVNGGALTDVEPTSGYSQPIAMVLRQQENNGALQVLADYPKQSADDVRYDNTAIPAMGTDVQGALDYLAGLHNDMHEPSGFDRKDTDSLGIIELTSDGTTIHRIDNNGNYSVRYDGTFATGDAAFETDASAMQFAIFPAAGQSSYTIYVGGKKCEVDAIKIVTMTTAAGLKYIYHDTNCDLAYSDTFNEEYFNGTPITSACYYDSNNSEFITFGDERHGIQMDGATHKYLHFTERTRYVSGMGLTGLSSGSTTHTQVDSGVAYDEDLIMTPSAQASLPHIYKIGDVWAKTSSNNDIALLSGGVAQYNRNTGGVYSLASVTGNDAMIVFFFLTNDAETPYAKILGQEVYGSVNIARANVEEALNQLILTGLPSPEFCPIGAVIVDSNGELELLSDGSEYLDLRTITVSGSGTNSGVINYHEDLLGRDAVDAHPTSSITGLQTALDEKADKTITVSGTGALQGSGSLASNVVIEHKTSIVDDQSNTGGTVVQTITFDQWGHGSTTSSINLDARYYTQSSADSTFAPISHSHILGDVTGLQTELDDLQNQIDALTGLSGGILSAEETKERDAGMSEAEFRALQNERKQNRVGSGYDDIVDIYDPAFTRINDGGLYVRTTPISGNANKLYFAITPNGRSNDFYVNGIKIRLFDVDNPDAPRCYLPTAPSDENARQDLVGLEVWEELVSDKDFVFPNGCVQASSTTMNGISTVIPSFSGYGTYCLMGNWQTSGDVVTRGLIWSTLSHANRMKVLQDPNNNLYYNEDGNLVQVRYRIRVVEGKTTNGAEWEKIIADADITSLRQLRYDSDNYIKPKGKSTSITNDLLSQYSGETRYFGLSNLAINTNKDMRNIGIGTAFDFASNYDTSIAYKGHCYFLPITMVSRNRNQGAFDAEFNPDGAGVFGGIFEDTQWNTDSDFEGWSKTSGTTGTVSGGVLNIVGSTLTYYEKTITTIAGVSYRLKTKLASTGSMTTSTGVYIKNQNSSGASLGSEDMSDDSGVEVVIDFVASSDTTWIRIASDCFNSFDSISWDYLTVEAIGSPSSTEEALTYSTGGNISSGVSGRPDGLYYDEINERDVRDLRLPTFYEEVTSARCNTELNKCFSNQNRGYEAEFEITHVSGDLTLSANSYTGSYSVGLCTNVLAPFNQVFGSDTQLDKNIKAFILGNDGNYYEICKCDTTYARVHPRHGGVTAIFLNGDTTKLIYAKRTDSFSNNKITRCEIIGDPANYNFDTHVGVPNLIDVNDLSSNLLVNKHAGTNGGYRLRLNKKFVQIGVSESTAALKVLADGIELPYISSYTDLINHGTVAGYYLYRETSEITFNINGDTTFNDNAVVEVYYEGYANEFDSSVNEEVENRIASDIVALNSNSVEYGALTYNELFGRIQTNSTAPYYSQLKANNVIIDSTDKITDLTHDAVTLANASGFKAFNGIANKNGLLYPCVAFKETIFDVDLGDNSKFEITDYIKTKLDDNANVITYGTVVSKNPIGFAKE